MSAREEAREAVHRRYSGGYIDEVIMEAIHSDADAASDVWEPYIDRILHQVEKPFSDKENAISRLLVIGMICREALG